MIEPVLADDHLLRDVREADRADPEGRGFRLWWLGQSGFLLQWRGRHVLFDPYLSDSLTEKYAGTDRPHVRMTRRPVAPERLGFVDVVAVSHHHTDHLDPATLRPLVAGHPAPRLIVPGAIRELAAERAGLPVAAAVGLDDGTETEAAGFRFQGVAAAHESVERDAAGRCRFLGFLVRFGPWTVYHAGDTVGYEGMAQRLHDARVDVALLPVNGRAPERGVPGNLSGPEAAALARQAGVRLAIPCHYEMFTFNTASPTAFAEAAERLGQPYRILRCGERWSSDDLRRR